MRDRGIYLSDLRQQRYEQLKIFLRKVTVESWGMLQGAAYGQLRAGLTRSGMVIGGNDMLIAAHALSAGAILVTNNQREFTRIPGLICENWLSGLT